jgi:molecular chaperone GrpE
MWYDNNDEEAQPKVQQPNSVAPESPLSPTGDFRACSFPAASDPTKAFDDDTDVLPGGAATADEVAALKEAIKELDNKANQNYDRYLRALAELENYKKRVSKERLDLLRYAGEDLLLEILPVVDNLDRTLEHIKDTSDPAKVHEGILLIQRQFQQALAKSGVTLINQAPCPFDPTIHQALQRVEDKSVPDDTVVEILQQGYILNGKVIRPAMVKVAKRH